MGLRRKAQKYLEMLISDRLDKLEIIYEGQTLSKEELLEIKGLIAKKIFQAEREKDKKIELLERILSYGRVFESIESKEKLLSFLFAELSSYFGVEKALFFEVADGTSRITRAIGLDESCIGKTIEWSLQENQCLSKGTPECFENEITFRDIASDTESYLLVPVKMKNNLLGGMIIFRVKDEKIKCFSSEESEKIFEWIATQIAPSLYMFLKA
jgi:transcriptional regulator with GAF, ATPase, and Fis domain